MNRKFSDVFRPGTFPQITYVSRYSRGMKYTYEERLLQSLSIDGYLTYIVGPSKMGKTVLCERVIGVDNMVSMSGNDFSRETDFWSGVGKKAGISMSSQIVQEHTNYTAHEQKGTVVTKDYFTTKDMVIKYFKEHKKVLVLDDFHYAPEEIQYAIACQLKEVIRLGFRAVIISLPYRSDDAIRLNPDLTGRISVIDIEPWKSDELKKIAEIGFESLGISAESPLMERMAEESIHSPQLMQSICFNLGHILEDGKLVTEKQMEDSCRLTCMNWPYGDVIRVLKAGPSTRGQKRKKYELKNGDRLDIYSIILKMLRDDPPLVELGMEELMGRIRNNLDDAQTDNVIKPDKIAKALTNWKRILDMQGSLYQVVDWKDDTIHILDNTFLFYLRWGGEVI